MSHVPAKSSRLGVLMSVSAVLLFSLGSAVELPAPLLALTVELARLCLLQNPTERRLTSLGLEQRERPAAELGLARSGAPSQTWFLPEATVWPETPGEMLSCERDQRVWQTRLALLDQKNAARSARRAE